MHVPPQAEGTLTILNLRMYMSIFFDCNYTSVSTYNTSWRQSSCAN